MELSVKGDIYSKAISRALTSLWNKEITFYVMVKGEEVLVNFDIGCVELASKDDNYWIWQAYWTFKRKGIELDDIDRFHFYTNTGAMQVDMDWFKEKLGEWLEVIKRFYLKVRYVNEVLDEIVERLDKSKTYISISIQEMATSMNKEYIKYMDLVCKKIWDWVGRGRKDWLDRSFGEWKVYYGRQRCPTSCYYYRDFNQMFLVKRR